MFCKFGGTVLDPKKHAPGEPSGNDDFMAMLQSASMSGAAGAGGSGYVLRPPFADDALLGAIADIEAKLRAGDKKAAVDAAVAHHLWSHALIISSHLTREEYQKVVAGFVAQTLPATSPLRPLYAVFGGDSSVRVCL